MPIIRSMNPDLSVLILTLNEEGNIGPLLKDVRTQLEMLRIQYEFIIVDGGSRDRTVAEAESCGAHCILQTEKGYANALRQGFRSARGTYVITLDADQSHPASLIHALWAKKDLADLIVASRFIPGGDCETSFFRKSLSKILNGYFGILLDLNIHDFSSGYRLYRREVLKPGRYFSKHFDILPEILIKVYADGYRLAEVPLQYKPRIKGKSNAQIINYGLSFLKTLYRMWMLRNSIESADYDYRAYYSKIGFQRYWQRKRHQIVMNCIDPNRSTVDIGCGSSKIICDLKNAVGMDISLKKLRFVRNANSQCVQGSAFDLPFADASFEQLIHSQVIEHIPYRPQLFTEMNRVLKEGGILVLGTPDYGRIWWPLIEFFYDKILPNAYAHEHITHYTKPMLENRLRDFGFEALSFHYICGGELIIKAKKIRNL